MLLQVVNLKEARDFSSGKDFIYVFKVITFPFLLFRNFPILFTWMRFYSSPGNIYKIVRNTLFFSAVSLILYYSCLHHCVCYIIYFSLNNRNLSGNIYLLTCYLIPICLRMHILEAPKGEVTREMKMEQSEYFLAGRDSLKEYLERLM